MTWIDELIWMRHMIAYSQPGWILDAELHDQCLQQTALGVHADIATVAWAIGLY